MEPLGADSADGTIVGSRKDRLTSEPLKVVFLGPSHL